MNPCLVYLVQTDTTAGFLSQDAAKLADVKQRISSKPFIKAFCSLSLLCVRIPKGHRRLVRRAAKTTFVVPPSMDSFRVVSDGVHHEFLSHFGWAYTTSANKANEPFDEVFAKNACDVVVEDSNGFFDAPPSKILFLGKRKIKKLR